MVKWYGGGGGMQPGVFVLSLMRASCESRCAGTWQAHAYGTRLSACMTCMRQIWQRVDGAGWMGVSLCKSVHAPWRCGLCCCCLLCAKLHTLCNAPNCADCSNAKTCLMLRLVHANARVRHAELSQFRPCIDGGLFSLRFPSSCRALAPRSCSICGS
jgi:hypothetical protein